LWGASVFLCTLLFTNNNHKIVEWSIILYRSDLQINTIFHSKTYDMPILLVMEIKKICCFKCSCYALILQLYPPQGNMIFPRKLCIKWQTQQTPLSIHYFCQICCLEMLGINSDKCPIYNCYNSWKYAFLTNVINLKTF